VNDLSRVVRLH